MSKFQIVQTAPADAASGTCWGNRVSPAVIETVEREILVQPAQVSSDGRIQQPAIYRKESRQEIVQERREVWTQIVCVTAFTDDFVASLQRALAARGFYKGPASGLMDNRTRTAIRKLQSEDGFEQAVLTLATARKLGLIAVERTQ
ncbi:peptidoglycan-binding domain-containing protein [Ascidiaceihabitans sp.]|uniref:peptidoglycan-binding domain-containing protein n=1 Tax=Ascidiaceihabitans sp. TaxID=1872644 RepID=UPI003299163C